jgi:tight adherence protein C
LDQPPTGFRLTWPLINLIAMHVGRFLTDNYRTATHLRLRRAGVEFTVSVEQFFAGKVVAGILFLGAVFLVQSVLHKESVAFLILACIGGFYYPEIWLKETMDTRNHKIFRALPFYLDIITLAVESGTNLTSGINQAVQKAPDSPLRSELARVLRDVRAGRSRSESLRDLTERVSCEGLNNVVSSMLQAEKTGASLGPVLRAQSDQLRSARFLKAEKLAMEAPVKLLGPLVAFIFPTTFLVIGFVILSKALGEGVITWGPLVWAFTHPM